MLALILKFRLKKRNPRHNSKNVFSRNILSEESKALFSVTVNIIISYIFSENFIEIHQVSQKIWIFTSSILTIFVNFLDFFTFTCYRKANDVRSYKIIVAVFWLILDKLLRNFIKLLILHLLFFKYEDWEGENLLTHPEKVTSNCLTLGQ